MQQGETRRESERERYTETQTKRHRESAIYQGESRHRAKGREKIERHSSLSSETHRRDWIEEEQAIA